uniref:Uncharacterized protein n=1 Tax=Anguilla anguilla TaxID=7936 RepID=A0A0E9Q0Y8_ANGAN
MKRQLLLTCTSRW